MPHGTVLALLPPDNQSCIADVDGGIMIPVKYRATVRANVRPDAQTFLDACATDGVVLSGVLRRNSNAGDVMHRCIVPDPMQEFAPTGITDALAQVAVLNHVFHLQVLVGNQIARCD